MTLTLDPHSWMLTLEALVVACPIGALIGRFA